MSPKHQDQEEAGQHRTAKIMVVMSWLLLLALLTLFFSNWLKSERNPNRHLSGQLPDRGAAEVILQRNRQGHYLASGRINGAPVEFLLDTGATVVSVPAILATELGLEKGPRHSVQTAKGEAQVWATWLAEVCLGPLCLHRVRATINPHVDEREVLLGMSVLKQLEFTQRGDQLVLRKMALSPGR